jgi:ribonucleotide monophosphatase NagD (HAD superfamily)
VVGLEHALERRATVTGKPSPVVFREALRELSAEVRAAGGPRLPAADVAMVGDDLESDIAGARRIGMRGILVLTGKTDRAGLEADSARRARRGRRGGRGPDGIGDGVLDVVVALLEAPTAAG